MITVPDLGLGGLIGSIAGGIAGSLAPFILANRREKKSIALALAAEFDSSEMYVVRTQAWKLIKECVDVRFDNMSILTTPNYDSMWALIGFYRRLHHLILFKRVDKDIVLSLFGQTFIWWYIISFEEKLVPVTKWDHSQHIFDLYEWFRINSDAAQFRRWVDAAKSDTDEIPKVNANKAL